MRTLNLKIRLVLSIILPLWVITCVFAADRQHDLAILFTHDLHSNIEEYAIPSGNDGVSVVGGYARISSAIKKESRGRANDRLVLDAGDFSMGTLFHTIRSTASAELVMMGIMGYDATTLGNHDLELGPGELAAALLAAKKNSAGRLPAMVASNTLVPEQIPELSGLRKAIAEYPVTPYQVFTRAGIRIGVFGLMGRDAASDVPQARPVVFESPIDGARRTVAALREKEKVDMVVCLSHSGTWANKDISEDEILANSVPGIDVIISGHTHTVLTKYLVVNNTIIVSSGAYGRYLGRLNITRKRDGSFAAAGYKLIPITSRMPKDPKISRLLPGYIKEINSEYLAPFHYHYGQPLTSLRSSLTVSSGLGGMIVSAFRDTIKRLEGKDYRRISLVVEPYGQIRAPLAKGAVTVNDAFRVLSLGSGPDGRSGYPLVSFWLTGKEIKNALEIETTVAPLKEDARLQVSGVRFTYDPAAPAYARITSAELDDEDGTLQPLDDARLYRVCTNLYVLLMSDYLKKIPGSKLAFTPKDASGSPVSDVNATRIFHDKQGLLEVKEWEALASYLKNVKE